MLTSDEWVLLAVIIGMICVVVLFAVALTFIDHCKNRMTQQLPQPSQAPQPSRIIMTHDNIYWLEFIERQRLNRAQRAHMRQQSIFNGLTRIRTRCVSKVNWKHEGF